MELFEQQYLTEQYIILTSKLNLNFSLQNSCTPHVLKFNDIRTANVHNRPRFGIYFKHLCKFICQDEKCRLMRDLSLSITLYRQLTIIVFVEIIIIETIS